MLAAGKREGKLGIASARGQRQREAPPKRGLTSVTGSDPSGSRKHWMFAGPRIPIASATMRPCSISSQSRPSSP